VLQSIGSLQKKYSIGSFELLSKTAPIQALFLLILGPFVDYYLSGKLITDYKMSFGAFVSSPINSSWLYVLLRILYLFIKIVLDYSINLFSLTSAVMHSSFMFASCILQCEPVPLHRALFCRFLPSFRTHENSMCSNVGMAAI